MPARCFESGIAGRSDLFLHSAHGTHERLLAAIHTGIPPKRAPLRLHTHAIFEVRGTGFWHGVGFGPRQHLRFFYFDDLQLGLASWSDPLDLRRRVHYVRVSPVIPVGFTMPGMTACSRRPGQPGRDGHATKARATTGRATKARATKPRAATGHPVALRPSLSLPGGASADRA